MDILHLQVAMKLKHSSDTLGGQCPQGNQSCHEQQGPPVGVMVNDGGSCYWRAIWIWKWDVICILTPRNNLSIPDFFKKTWVRHFGPFRRRIQEEVNIVAGSALALLAIAFNVSSRPVNKKRFLLRWLSYNEGSASRWPYDWCWLILSRVSLCRVESQVHHEFQAHHN